MSFLRRFCCLNDSSFLVLLDLGGLHPALSPIPPHPPRHGHLLLNRTTRFLASPHCHRVGHWAIQYIRDGRLAVCDPLHRRYIMLPAVPQDLAPFLLPFDDDGNRDVAMAFRLIGMERCLSRVDTFELNTINKDFLMLYTGSMEFSIVDLPPREWTMNIAIVEAGEGRLGLFGIVPQVGGDIYFKKLPIERVYVKSFQFVKNGTHIYTNFPPWLSIPTI
ncbi:hypothetical protein ZWY2020_027466 [Hordeum vulgare]|nr:hypothetical protein ZWY2020_027466 [Hordeum vulgare]